MSKIVCPKGLRVNSSAVRSCDRVLAFSGDIFSLPRRFGGGETWWAVVFVVVGVLHLRLHASEFVGEFVLGQLVMRVLGDVEVFVVLGLGALGDTGQAAGLFYLGGFRGAGLRGWLLGGFESSFGRKGEIDIGGEPIFHGHVGGFEGAEGLGVFDLRAAACWSR